MQSMDIFSAENLSKTHFSNKLGVYSEEDQTVTWTAGNGVRIVSYPAGRGFNPTYDQYEKGNYLGKMITLAKEAFEDREESVFSQTLVRGIWPLNRTFHWHLFFDPHLTPIVTSFTRYPQVDDAVLKGSFDPALENDLSTPYNSALSKGMMQKAGLFFSSFALPPESYAVIHNSIKNYYGLSKNSYKEWAELSDKQFFKPWSEKNEWIEGHASFSSMTWATVSKFILGVSDDEFVDYAHIWNTLLQGTKGITEQGIAKFWYFPEMETYVLKKIRDTKTQFLLDPSAGIGLEKHETIIHYWLQNNIAEAMINKLTLSMREEALSIAENRGITLEEMVYLDNFFGVMIGMQENIAFILTQIAYHFARDQSIAARCRNSEGDCEKMVAEVLRFMPPAGTSRELRWDSDVIDPIKNKIYFMNKGDQLLTMPAVTMHLEAFSPQHDVFDIDRPRTHSLVFSEGPHRCPGQIPALKWLYALTHRLAQYEFCREGLEEPEYYTSFILRDGDMQFKVFPQGHFS